MKTPNDPRELVRKKNPNQGGHASGDKDPASALDQIVQNDKSLPPFKGILINVNGTNSGSVTP